MKGEMEEWENRLGKRGEKGWKMREGRGGREKEGRREEGRREGERRDCNGDGSKMRECEILEISLIQI